MLQAFRVAFSFLTRIPVSAPPEASAQLWGKSLIYYPLVGLMIGVLLAVLHRLIGRVPDMMEAAMLLGVWVLITGALHLDGLADTADGIVGGHQNKDRILSIMKDPTSGPMGITAIVLILVFKFAALTVILTGNYPYTALLIAPIAGRAMLLVLFLTLPYLRAEGVGHWISENFPKQQVLILLIGLSLAVLILQWKGLALLLLLALLAAYFHWDLVRRIGGTTGDTAGAVCEVTEAAVLVFFAVG